MAHSGDLLKARALYCSHSLSTASPALLGWCTGLTGGGAKTTLVVYSWCKDWLMGMEGSISCSMDCFVAWSHGFMTGSRRGRSKLTPSYSTDTMVVDSQTWPQP